jgi:uncharacterized membrane protein YfcA
MATICAFVDYDMQALIDSLSLNLLPYMITLLSISNATEKIDWKSVAMITVGNLLGTPLGYQFIAVFGDKPIFKIVLGSILISFGVMGIKSVKHKKIAAVWSIPIGILAGFIGGAFTTGGPPIMMYLYSRTDAPQKMKATLQTILFLGIMIRYASMFWGGRELNLDKTIQLIAWSLSFSLGILLAGHYLSLKTSPRTFLKIVNILITFFGGLLFTKAAMTTL